MKEHCYASYASCGVHTTDFYKVFDTTIAGVSRATGVSRKAVSKVPIKNASAQSTESVILYLEEVSAGDYSYAVRKCKKDIVEAFKNLEKEWEIYLKRERMLCDYRCKYRISRNMTLAKKVTLWEVLRCIKSL